MTLSSYCPRIHVYGNCCCSYPLWSNGNASAFTVTDNTTLGELLTILKLGDKPHETPTPKMLRETAGVPIATEERCTVYANGYAVYDNGSGRTVVWLPSCTSFTYHLPHFRIRARMIQLGNIEAKGALNYVARELIEPFAFNTDSWREEQHTFVVDEDTVKHLQKKSPDLQMIMESGKYVYRSFWMGWCLGLIARGSARQSRR